MSLQIQNVFDAIIEFGHDEDFMPRALATWEPTDAIAGTAQKVQILRSRVEMGVPLFHPNDNQECLCSNIGTPSKAPSIRIVKLCAHRGALLSE